MLHLFRPYQLTQRCTLIGLLSYIRLQLGLISCFEFYVAAQGKTQQQTGKGSCRNWTKFFSG
jgi:hypothetical protein